MYEEAIQELREEANRLKELACKCLNNGLVDVALITHSNAMLTAATYLECKSNLERWKTELGRA